MIIHAIVGIRNESFPKAIRHTTEAIIPIREEMCRFSLSQFSRKITINIEVITKSMPVVSNLINPPIREPRVDPVIQ